MLRKLFLGTTARYFLHARLLWRAAPALAVACVLVTAAASGAIVLAMITSGRLIGALAGLVRSGGSGPAADRAWLWFGWSAAAFTAAPICQSVAEALAARISRRYLVTTYDMLLEIGTHPYQVERFDDPGFAGRLTALHQAMRDWSFVSGVDNTWVVLSTKFSAIGSLVIACTWRWWVAVILVVLGLVCSKVVTTWIHTFMDDLLEVTGGARREATYLRKLLTAGATGKEIRLFGLADYLIDRFRDTWLSAMELVWRNRQSTMKPVIAVLSAGFLLNTGAVALLAHDAVSGAVSLAALATLVQALMGIADFGPMGDPQTLLSRTTVAADELRRLRSVVGLPELPARTPGSGQPVSGAAPGTAAAVELTDVRFTYPTRSEPTIERLTLRIPPGQSVGIVGVNGAGKSTLIKLLCGLYEPEAGTVRIDGRDPASDPRARRRIAVIFQDFVRYHLSVRDNVGFGAGWRPVDDDVIRDCLQDAGALGLLDRLEPGLDTVLSPEYAEGTDLSGGQWQRIALARAFASLASGAGILVLDEPTAALDVRAEAALFERFLSVTRGMTTLLVSHRLSSVRHAERIIVIGRGSGGEGAVVEDGSHEQLMAAGGEYARMFSLQASRFAAAGAVE